jgi:flagellar biosynthetic protein FliR
VNLTVPIPVDIIRYAALLARLGGFLVLAPVTGARVVPVRWRVLLCVAVAVTMGSVLPGHWRIPQANGPIGLPYLAILIGGELLLGIMVSLFVHIMFEIFSFGGQVVGINMGFAFAQQIDPTLERQNSLLSVFMTQLLTIIFVSTGGIHLLVRLAVLSVYRFPPGAASPATIGVAPMVSLAGQIFAIGFQLALPIFCVTLVINVALGLMTRFGQDFEVLMLAFPVRIAVGFFIIAGTIPVWVGLASHLIDRVMHRVAELLQA